MALEFERENFVLRTWMRKKERGRGRSESRSNGFESLWNFGKRSKIDVESNGNRLSLELYAS